MAVEERYARVMLHNPQITFKIWFNEGILPEIWLLPPSSLTPNSTLVTFRTSSMAKVYVFSPAPLNSMATGAESVCGNGPSPGVERSNVPLTTRGADIWYAHVLARFKGQVSVKTAAQF